MYFKEIRNKEEKIKYKYIKKKKQILEGTVFIVHLHGVKGPACRLYVNLGLHVREPAF